MHDSLDLAMTTAVNYAKKYNNYKTVILTIKCYKMLGFKNYL